MTRTILKTRWLGTAVAATALLAGPALVPAQADTNSQHFTADLGSLNDSGVTGTASLWLDNDSLKVHIDASGLQPGMAHPQHIHGTFDSSGNTTDATSPTLSQDTNGDGYIELGEGAATYGSILVPLTSPPGGAVSDFPTAPDGTIDFTQIYDLTDGGIYNKDFDENDLFPLDFREIVLHGMTAPVDINDNLLGQNYGEGDYDPVFPVASGEIVASAVSVPGPGSILMMVTGFGLLLGFMRLRKKD